MLFKSTVFVLFVAGAFATKPLPSTPTYAPKASEDDAVKWLLPNGVEPRSYNLTLTPNFETLGQDVEHANEFKGNVVISVEVVAETVDAIVLHKSNEMTITKATLKSDVAGAQEQTLDFSTYDNETNKLTLKGMEDPPVPLTNGNYTVSIEYTGLNKDDMHGFYRSSYVNAEGKTRWLLTTQFESYDARRAYPCFDEPRFKATYVITVIIPTSLKADGYSVLSNMPIAVEYPKDDSATDTTTYRFQQSAKRISSYLVAFIISDFKSTPYAAFQDDTKEFRTWAQSGPIEAGQGKISQLAGTAALDVIRKNTKVDFAYPKVDQVGIPDFNAGAMENWGLVTYRERYILFDENIHPLSQKQSVVTVTTHELGHQWFGDLVTLHWWSDIWLNEGFATFFEYHASDEIRGTDLDTSTWKLVYQMVADELQANAFATDAQPNARALTTTVYAPGEIDANFDNVAYAKGGSVIRMWMHTLGRDNFYNALESYLNANAEKVGTPELLLGEFDRQVPADLQGVLKPTDDFKSWHMHPGYPVLHVKREGNTSTITQERFLVSGKDDSKPKWTVPITLTTSTEPDFDNTAPSAENIFKSDMDEIVVEHGDADWVLFNLQQTGYYRVNYEAADWKALTQALVKDLNVIHEVNRAQLLDDALWLARSTNDYKTDYTVALSLTKFLEKEMELIPWKPALNGFSFLYGKLANTDDEPKLKKLILKRLENAFKNLTLNVDNGDSHTRRLLRPLIASMACRLQQEDCISAAKKMFSAQINGSNSADEKLSPDVKSTVMCTGIRESVDSQSTWDQVWGLYQNATDNAEQTIYLSALGCSKNMTIIEGYLNKTIVANSGIRRQDLASVFSAALNGNPENVEVALNFLEKNLESIASSYGGMDPVGGLMTSVAAKLGTKEELDKIKALRTIISDSKVEAVHNGLSGANIAVDLVTANNEWLENKQKSISGWLNSDANDTGGASAATITIISFVLPALLILKFSS